MSRQTLVQTMDDVGFGAGAAGHASGSLWRRAWRAVFRALSGDQQKRPAQRRPAAPQTSATAPVTEPALATASDDFAVAPGDTMQTAVITVAESPRPAVPPPVTPPRDNPLRHYCESILYSLRKSAGDGESLPRVIGVTSCYAGEGVTTLATELALTAATGERPVLLADANFGSPSLHRAFRTDLSPGLAEAFLGGLSLEQTVRELPGTSLSLVTAGRAARGTQSHFADGLGQLAEFAAEHYDFALVDLPPLNRPAETLPLCGVLDGVLLLVEAERVRWPVAERFVGELTRSGAKPLGVVMNKQKHHVPQWLYRTL